MVSAYAFKPALPAHIADILTPFPVRHDQYMQVSRRLAAASADGMRSLKVAYLSSFTVDQLVPYVTAELAQRGGLADNYIAPFGQIEQELLDRNSGLHRHSADVVFIAIRLEDILPDLPALLLEQGPAASRLVVEAANTLVAAIGVALSLGKARYFVFNMCEPPVAAAGIAGVAEDFSEPDAVHLFNRTLGEFSRRQSAVHIVDYRATAFRHGLGTWQDRKLWYWARSPLTSGAMVALSETMARAVQASLNPSCKCLVLDCDNTLWGGVVGEDGLDGIQLGETYPGNVYKSFHAFLKSLKARGILLAVASKNNRGDAMSVFERHPDSVLKPGDFSAFEIHWNDKASSIRAIADTLSIGLDSIAFFDDSPVERQWMRETLPMVRVIDAPADPLFYIDAVRDSELFDQIAISAEDRARHSLYRAEQDRAELQQSTTSMDDFLRRLEMRATIGPVNEGTLRRVGQLMLKTNQFNLSLRRHSPADIQDMLRNGGIGLWMRLEDKFGDNGLIAVALARPDGEEWEVDSFLMSCRVLGRQAETLLLHTLAEQCRRRGAARLRGIYTPGPRNQMVADFYRRHQFSPGADEKVWLWDFSNGSTATANHIECTMVE